ncbi:hypothetical protein [Streptomyces sp. NPDC001165]|uniref:hypothetical protein n=1 Tax=Streptomyces sp. NPDC001165 TaxID=3364546 RepID=UPI003685A19B
MATVDPAHRVGFALIPALADGLIIIGIWSVAGASPNPWMWLGAIGAGSWGYRYARRWSSARHASDAKSAELLGRD